ncbi:uncharacterized protein LOC132199050 [Neocloeon triangulifer]|uniref:uncharacterized protein LOC132199050 n=1 Tax=Neocloeon triangulifer TaxID=2078957 RepID=UPI00286EB550|nr:uncharacterized protein LOC132199050 [Neocloeon triangulifer]
MQLFAVAFLLAGCLASSLKAANFDIGDLEKVWPDLEQQQTDNGDGTVLSSDNNQGVALAADTMSASDPPKEGDPIDKYLLKDTDDFTIARDSNGRPILLSSVQETGALPLLFGVDGHGHLIQASSDRNFSLESIPAVPTDPVKASDLGANVDTPRSPPQAPNPPTPPTQTSLSWPSHKPVVVEEHGWPAPVNVYKHGHSHGYHHHHHNFESWPSEQKPVTSGAPQDDAPHNFPRGQAAFDQVQYDERPRDSDMPPMHKGAPSTQFPQGFSPSSVAPETSQGPWESVRTNPRAPKAPWEGMRNMPESPEGPFYTEQAFLGMKRTQPPVQG